MSDQKGFAGCAPAANLIFFAAVIVFNCVIMHPVFLAISLASSALYYITLNADSGIKPLLGLIPVFAVITLVNPVFNSRGNTVLFEVFGRPYTLEALLAGLAAGAMISSLLIWFMCLGKVMTSDKMMSLFADLIPGISMLLIMIFRLIPDYIKKGKTIIDSRKALGMMSGDDKKERKSTASNVMGSLTGWAFESSVITSDSMKSRGYGCARRTSFKIYKNTKRDIIIMAAIILAAAIIAIALAAGIMTAQYTPDIMIAGIEGPLGAAVIIIYALMNLLPVIFDIWEKKAWNYSRSKI